ncbi:MAG: bifunctional transaldolase/phosoglucose isomerase [Thermoflexales bacterium]|nr:bifunctional transaldolase/phosoglucose isomerase [Thermoflexales bacterium]
MNALHQLKSVGGQSLWWDDVRREYLVSGELERLVEQDGILGVTSNPSIFKNAIVGSTTYDQAIRALVEAGKSSQEIYAALTLEDITQAVDVLRPVYERTDGGDGYVSLEVSPLLAADATGTVREARLLWEAIQRPNLMIKVPATPESIPAVRELIASGINVNATLIFSIQAHEEVMEAYLAGLEDRASSGAPLDKIASVASFFVSRVDTLVDRLLDERIGLAAGEDEKARLRALQGQAAVANAKLAYARFKQVFGSPRFAALAAKGARVQRPLWASTSTKNPAYRDVLYVEELIGPDTVNTAPPVTVAAFKDHGVVAATLERDVDKAHALMKSLAEVGIDMDAVTTQLLDEGVKAFADAYRDLLAAIGAKRAQLLSASAQPAALGKWQAAVDEALDKLAAQRFASRLWAKDGSLWKDDPAEQASIRARLGWLEAPRLFLSRCDELEAFSAELKQAGFSHALLLGMGGSSMAPELFRTTFGVAEGYLDLHVLDTTDPASVLAAEQALDLPHTLFIVASKSGGTIEVMSFFKYFYDKLRAIKGEAAGENFVAITDPGTSLEKLAAEKNFRHTFLNPPDIGGRYSALSYFGLLPAALLGMDVRRLLKGASEMASACAPEIPLPQNPGAWMGAVMGGLHEAGRDKLTFALSPQIAAFGYWLEQLVAESTGKEGKGILPVESEPLGEPVTYGDDRLFVHLKLDGDETHTAALAALQAAGQPVVTLHLGDVYELGGEFFRWELATAAASALMGVNPFDQPDVQGSKVNTQAMLDEYVKTGCLPETLAVLADTCEPALKGCLHQVKPGDFIALMAYIQHTPEHDALLAELRARLRDRFQVATTVGYGPRFLHSTGQLHKASGAKGVFIQITADAPRDVPIPGEAYSFGVLLAAQAMGDMQALLVRRRRALRLHLTGGVREGLEHLLQSLE